jgi:DNA primase
MTQSFYCFGCRAHGDVIAFVMKIEQILFTEAITRIRELAA